MQNVDIIERLIRLNDLSKSIQKEVDYIISLLPENEESVKILKSHVGNFRATQMYRKIYPEMELKEAFEKVQAI